MNLRPKRIENGKRKVLPFICHNKCCCIEYKRTIVGMRKCFHTKPFYPWRLGTLKLYGSAYETLLRATRSYKGTLLPFVSMARPYYGKVCRAHRSLVYRWLLYFIWGFVLLTLFAGITYAHYKHSSATSVSYAGRTFPRTLMLYAVHV